MRRDTLELADDSLFIERIKGRFAAADADPKIREHAFLFEKACADDSTAHKAAALLTPPLCQEFIDPSEIRERFGSSVAASIEDLCSPFIPTTDGRQLRQRDIHVILSSIGSVSRKAFLFIIFRLLALHKDVVSSGGSSREMAQDTLDLLVPTADRPGVGDLRRCLEDTCFRLQDAGARAPARSPDAFIKLLHRQVFHDQVVVFGSGARVVRLDENATVRDYLNMANVRISEDALVKVNGTTAALDLTLKDGDSIEVLEDGDQSTGGIDTCTIRGNGFDPAGSMHLFKEDYNGKKLLRNSRGDIGRHTR